MKHLLMIGSAILLLNFSFFISYSVAATFQLPQTGQSKCYDTDGFEISCVGTGQDGDKLAGVALPSPRFTDNNNQTVTDLLTGLIWVKDANLIKSRDPAFDNDYTPSDGQVALPLALDYIKKLNTENYQGFNDWRLPNVNELESMVNNTSDNSGWLNSQGFVNSQASQYWTSTTDAVDTIYALTVDISNNNITGRLRVSSRYVWPVRGGLSGAIGSSIISLPNTRQTACYDANSTYYTPSTIACSGSGQDGEYQAGAAWPSQRFLDNGDQTISDSLTGLTWLKYAASYDVGNCGYVFDTTWQVALNYVKCMNQNTYINKSDWRLPNINELQSLVNWSQGNMSGWLNSQGFIGIKPQPYWTSTTDSLLPNKAQLVSFYGGLLSSYKTDSHYFLPVRGGTFSDSTPPTISTFIVPSSSSSTTVAITTLTATDNIGVTDYCLSETNDSTECTWNTNKPASYTFSTTGIVNLYAFARDAAGNVSASATDSTIITLQTSDYGVCGTSNGGSFTVAPTTNFCSTGTATAVTGTGPWFWNCTGSNGGTTATCSARIQTYTITAFITAGNGTVSCTSSPSITTSTCTVTPATGYQLATFTDNGVDKIGAVAGGSYSIANVTANHSIVATFNQIPPTTTKFTVTTTSGSGYSITPATSQIVNTNATTSFTVTPTSGYGIASVAGCGGNFSVNTYTTAPITADCTISVTAVARNANSDGSALPPTINDALKVLQVVVGITPLTATDQIRYDVAPLAANGAPLGNGVLDASDVIAILRRSIGIGSW